MAKKFGATLTDAQIAFARRVERAGLTSYSQAVKAFERGETDKIRFWRDNLAQIAAIAQQS